MWKPTRKHAKKTVSLTSTCRPALDMRTGALTSSSGVDNANFQNARAFQVEVPRQALSQKREKRPWLGESLPRQVLLAAGLIERGQNHVTKLLRDPIRCALLTARVERARFALCVSHCSLP